MYSANQVRQLYVVDNDHPLAVKVCDSVDHFGDKFFSMEYTDDLGKNQLVDIIENADIRKVTVKAAPTLKGRQATITINAAPSASYEAYLTIVAPGFYGDTLENKEVFPINITSADVTAASNSVGGAFAAAINANKTLSKHFVATSSGSTNLVITEVFNVNEYRLGVYNLSSSPFTIAHGHYVDNTEDDHLSNSYTPALYSAVAYAETSNATVTVTVNGTSVTKQTQVNGSYELAQLEWFCHGFRGDVYREKAFPNDYQYKGLVNPSASGAYYTCDIHYFWHGYGNQVDKSEKVLTFVGTSTDMTAIQTAITGKTTNARIPADQQAGGNG